MKVSALDLGMILNAFRRVLGPNYSPAVDGEVRRIAKAHLKSLSDYGAAGQRAKTEVVRGREYIITQSVAAKMVAFVMGYPKAKKSSLTLAQVREKAHAINARGISKDALRARVTAKPDGGGRITCSASIARRAQVQLVTHLILARVGYSPFEYVRKGRGRDAAAAAGLHAIQHHGVRWLGLADVKSFFSSCRREMAYAVLPISRKLIDNVVFVPKATPIHFIEDTNTHYTNTTLEHAVRLGLIEGSQVSGLVAQKILEPCLRAVSTVLTVCHGDNVMIGASTKAECLAKTSAFASLLEKHPGGPLQLKEKFVLQVGDPTMDFCGYRLRRKKWAGKSLARATPSKKAFTRLDRRMFVRLFTANAENDEPIITDYVGRWARSFKLWAGKSPGAGLAEICIFTELVPLVGAALAKVAKAGSVFSNQKAREAYAALLASKMIPTSVSWQGP